MKRTGNRSFYSRPSQQVEWEDTANLRDPLFYHSLMQSSPSCRSDNEPNLFSIHRTRSVPPIKIPKGPPPPSFCADGRVDKQSGNAGVRREAVMEMQESGKSEKGGGGGGGGVVVVVGGDGKTTTDISGNFTGMANPM